MIQNICFNFGEDIAIDFCTYLLKYNHNSEDSLESLCEEFVKVYLLAISRYYGEYDVIDINWRFYTAKLL